MKLKDEICFNLMTFIRKSPNEIVMPNYYFGFYEMDVFKLSPLGFVTEYEIKTSRGDFRNDFKKSRKVNTNPKDPTEVVEIFKHEEIENGFYKANKFFFVVPEGLVKPEEIPKHCGLIYYKNERFETIQAPKFIHKNKFEEKGFKDLCKSLSWREMSIRLKNIQLIKEVERLKKNNNF